MAAKVHVFKWLAKTFRDYFSMPFCLYTECIKNIFYEKDFSNFSKVPDKRKSRLSYSTQVWQLKMLNDTLFSSIKEFSVKLRIGIKECLIDTLIQLRNAKNVYV